jgi:hypothetical protein
VISRSLFRLLLFCSVLLAAASPSRAEGWTAGGGGLIPEGNLSDVAENGYHVFAGYYWKFGPVEVEPAARYMWAEGEDGAADLKIFGGEVSGRVGLFFFYVVGGLGYYKVERTLSLENVIEIDDWDLSYSFGAGFEFGPVFVEARYQKIDTERGSGFFPISVGFRF